MHRITLRRSVAVVTGVGLALGAALLVTTSPAGATRPLAMAVLHDAAGDEVGTVVFSGSGSKAESVEVQLSLPASATGLGSYHGLHVHTIGQCTSPFTSAGGHWNLLANAGATHGSHTGDLPSMLVAPDGTASATFVTHRFDVAELFDSDGSAVVLHLGPDNFGNVPIAGDRYADPNGWYTATGGTASTGDAGSRYACGVVQPR